MYVYVYIYIYLLYITYVYFLKKSSLIVISFPYFEYSHQKTDQQNPYYTKYLSIEKFVIVPSSLSVLHQNILL